MPKKSENSAVDDLIAERLRSAPAMPLCQEGSVIHYGVEFWCDTIAPEAIMAFLDRKVREGVIGGYTPHVPYRYAKNADAPQIFWFDVKREDLENLGIELGRPGRCEGHIPGR